MKITIENKIEMYSTWFFDELKEHGYLIDYTREPETLTVADNAKYGKLVRFKRKEDEVQDFNLFPKLTYTYDYILLWHESARYLFFDTINPISRSDDFHSDRPGNCFVHGRPPLITNRCNYLGEEHEVSRVDVKPTATVAKFGKTSSSITFVYKQRMIYDHTGIVIEKFIPIPMAGSGKRSSRFLNMFTPRRYMLTDAGKQARRIRFPITSIEGYVDMRKKFLNI